MRTLRGGPILGSLRKGGLFIQRCGKEKKVGSSTPALNAFKIAVAEDAQHVQPCAYTHVPTQPSHLPECAVVNLPLMMRCERVCAFFEFFLQRRPLRSVHQYLEPSYGFIRFRKRLVWMTLFCPKRFCLDESVKNEQTLTEIPNQV